MRRIRRAEFMELLQRPQADAEDYRSEGAPPVRRNLPWLQELWCWLRASERLGASATARRAVLVQERLYLSLWGVGWIEVHRDEVQPARLSRSQHSGMMFVVRGEPLAIYAVPPGLGWSDKFDERLRAWIRGR